MILIINDKVRITKDLSGDIQIQFYIPSRSKADGTRTEAKWDGKHKHYGRIENALTALLDQWLSHIIIEELEVKELLAEVKKFNSDVLEGLAKKE